MKSYNTLSEKVEILQNLLVSYSTGGQADSEEFKRLRTELLEEPLISDQLPRFLRTCRDLPQFWQFIKYKFSTYQERRQYLWEEFGPIIDMLERKEGAPSDEALTKALEKLDSDTVHEIWQRALERRLDDPKGAITAARTLIESVCKHILDDKRIAYSDKEDLPRLYKLTAETLSLAPSQQSLDIMKRVLGSCASVVEGIGALRNKLGDAHGEGKIVAKPEVRHAELVVNLAGTMATFLIATWEAEKDKSTHS